MQLQRWNVGVLIAALVAVVMGALMVRDSDGPRRPLVNSVFRDARPVLDPFLIELEERTFRFFWDTANPKNGLIPDRYPTPSFSSIAAARAGNQCRLAARGRISRIRLARLQRGDAGLSAGAGLADLRGWAASLDRMDQHLRQELAQGLRPGIPELRAPLRAPVHARMDGFSQDPGRLHAPARARLFREQPSGHLRAAGLRDRQSAGLPGLRRDDVGDHGERWAGRCRARGRERQAQVPRLRRARHRYARRLHARAYGDGGLDPVRTRAGDSGGARDASPLRAIYLFRIWLFRRVQSKLPFRRASEPRPRRGGIRLGRRRLSRHRS